MVKVIIYVEAGKRKKHNLSFFLSVFESQIGKGCGIYSCIAASPPDG